MVYKRLFNSKNESISNKIVYRISSIGGKLPISWSYGDITSSSPPVIGFQHVDLSWIVSAILGDPSIDGEYSIEKGYKHVLRIEIKNQEYDYDWYWSKCPEDVNKLWVTDIKNVIKKLSELLPDIPFDKYFPDDALEYLRNLRRRNPNEEDIIIRKLDKIINWKSISIKCSNTLR